MAIRHMCCLFPKSELMNLYWDAFPVNCKTHFNKDGSAWGNIEHI